MADDVRMDVDAAVTTASAMAGTSGAGPSSAPTHTGNPQSPAQQPQDGEEGGQEDEDAEMNVINTLEVDSERADNDSSLGSDISSMLTSVKSRALAVIYQNGRRYQASSSLYHLPNDIEEMDRLELQHLIWVEIMGGRHYLAPLHQINHLTHVLDVGTGTGNWAIDFANMHPEVKVLGTDLSPIQPDYVPTNCDFIIDDATHEWSFDQRFDYIHTRTLTMGIADWDKFVDQAYNFLQPGGILELQECHFPLDSPDGSLREGGALWAWGRKMVEVCGRLGIDARASTRHGERLRRRGFRAVEEHALPCPLGPWARGQRQKRLGWMARKDLYEGIDGISRRLFSLMGEPDREIDAFLARCKDELMDPDVHAIMCLDIVWGQRPYDS